MSWIKLIRQRQLLLLLLMITATAIYGQDTNKEAVATLKKLSAAYTAAPYLGFDILYRYATENAPGVYLDSLSGHVKTSGNRYWYELDNMESVYTPDYVIRLFREDKLMYLTKQLPGAVNPVNAFTVSDSFFITNANITCSMQEMQERTIIIIRFNEPGIYKRMEYYIDNKTGYLSKMISVIQAEQLYDPSVRSKLEGPAWAIVETVYSNYNTAPIDENLFSSDRYFKKEGNEYVVTAAYEDYKIFLGKVGM